MIKFIKHCIKYFTHIIPIEIKKDTILDKEKWYKVSCYMYLDKNNNVLFDEIRIDRKKEKKDESKSIYEKN